MFQIPQYVPEFPDFDIPSEKVFPPLRILGIIFRHISKKNRNGIPQKSSSPAGAPITQECVLITQQCILITQKCIPVTQKCAPVTQKCVPITQKCVLVTKKCVPVTQKCVPIALK